MQSQRIYFRANSSLLPSKCPCYACFEGYSWRVLVTPAQHINFGHSHFPQKIPPKSPKWDPQNEFPGIPRIGVFCGNSPQTLNFPEFPGHPDFSTLGSPFSAFWGETAEVFENNLANKTTRQKITLNQGETERVGERGSNF